MLPSGGEHEFTSKYAVLLREIAHAGIRSAYLAVYCFLIIPVGKERREVGFYGLKPIIVVYKSQVELLPALPALIDRTYRFPVYGLLRNYPNYRE